MSHHKATLVSATDVVTNIFHRLNLLQPPGVVLIVCYLRCCTVLEVSI